MKHGLPDIIYSTGLPVTSNLIGKKLALETNRPFVSEWRDPWVDNRYRPYLLSTKKKMDRSLERRVLQSADLTIAVNPPVQRLFQELVPSQSKKIRLLRNGYDPDDFTSIDTRQIPWTDLPSGRNPVRIVYMGRLYLAQNPKPLFKAIANLYDQGIERGTFKLGFYSASIPSEHERAIKENDLQDDISFKPYVSHDQAIKILSESDLMLVIEPHMDVIPGKVYECTRARGHILGICPRGSALDVELSETGCSTTAEFDTVQLERTLRGILEKIKTGTLVRQSNEDYLRTRSREYQVRVLDGWLRQLINTRS